jgi:hypothetical protein
MVLRAVILLLEGLHLDDIMPLLVLHQALVQRIPACIPPVETLLIIQPHLVVTLLRTFHLYHPLCSLVVPEEVLTHLNLRSRISLVRSLGRLGHSLLLVVHLDSLVMEV